MDDVLRRPFDRLPSAKRAVREAISFPRRFSSLAGYDFGKRFEDAPFFPLLRISSTRAFTLVII